MLNAKVEEAVSLAWGLPSFRTPAYIRKGIAERLARDHEAGMYALPDGLPEFRERVAHHHYLETGIDLDLDKEVTIPPGNMQGLNMLLHVIINPGDKIIVTDPSFASYVQQIRLCGGSPVYWQLCEDTGWASMWSAYRASFQNEPKRLS